MPSDNAARSRLSWKLARVAGRALALLGAAAVLLSGWLMAQRSPLARSNRRSAFLSFRPNGKDYGDPLNRLRWGLNDTIVAVREMIAIGVYRYRGQA